ncbi:hypothetical protein [Pseudoxanthomonas japonensis]|uniref:hypothetical protein n=1 Tax=Pseudoxanthomonas japonensis TaxID=69284 RepID=UPI003749301D
MSIRSYVRAVELSARDLGITLSMAKLRDAITKALFNKSYSACVAADDAGTLRSVMIPPPYFKAVAESYRLDPILFAKAFLESHSSAPATDEFNAMIGKLKWFSDDVPIRESPKQFIRWNIGYKYGRYWEPKLPLTAPKDLGRMVEFKNVVASLVPKLGKMAEDAASGVMAETTVGMAWDLLPNESVFLQTLRVCVATQQVPTKAAQISALLRDNQILKRTNQTTGKEEYLLPYVPLPMAQDVGVPVLYDVVLDFIGEELKILDAPEDSRSDASRCPEIYQSHVTDEQRAAAALKASTLAELTTTVYFQLSRNLCHGAGTSLADIQRDGLKEGLTRLEWRAEVSDNRKSPGTHQSLMVWKPGNPGESFFGPSGTSVGVGSMIPPDVFASLRRTPIQMTTREHIVYWFVWGYEVRWAIPLAGHIRLSGDPISSLSLPPCSPMACAVRVGASWSPAIIIAFDNEKADALVIAPGMLNDTARMVVPVKSVREGVDAFAKAIRAKARLLDYELDDMSGAGVPIAGTFWEARALWKPSHLTSTQSSKTVLSHRKISWSEEVLKSNPARHLEICLAHLRDAECGPTDLSDYQKGDISDQWDTFRPLHKSVSTVFEKPLVPARWFTALTGLAKLAGSRTLYREVIATSIQQISRSLAIANHCGIEDVQWNLMCSVGKILSYASTEGHFDLVARSSRSLLRIPGDWRRWQPAYFAEPYNISHATELETWIIAADVARKRLDKALKHVTRLAKANPESHDLRVMELGIRSALDPDTFTQPYVDAFSLGMGESLGYLCDSLRMCMEDDLDYFDKDEFDMTSFLDFTDGSFLHSPCAVAHALIAEMQPASRKLIIESVKHKAILDASTITTSLH